MTPLLVVCLVGVAPGDREAVRDALVIEGWKGDREPSASFVSGLEACPPATAVSVSVAPESARVRAGDATNEVTLAGLGEADRAVEIARAAMASVAPSSDPLAGLGEVAVAPTAPSPRALAGPTLVAGPTPLAPTAAPPAPLRLAAGAIVESRAEARALTRATLGASLPLAPALSLGVELAWAPPSTRRAELAAERWEIGGYAMLDLALRLAARLELGLGVGAGALYRHTRIDGVGARGEAVGAGVAALELRADLPGTPLWLGAGLRTEVFSGGHDYRALRGDELWRAPEAARAAFGATLRAGVAW